MAKIKKYKDEENTLEDAVSTAFGDLAALGEEMREAYDNTPESLQNSSVGEARSEAADALENLSEPSVPEELKQLKVTYSVPNGTPRQMMKMSRPSRRDNAVIILDAVSQFLGEMQDDDKVSDELKEIVEAFQQEVDDLKDNAEAVEFPSMYGR